MSSISLLVARNLPIGKGVGFIPCQSQSARSISTSASLLGKRNFRKFFLGNKRGTIIERRDRSAGKIPELPVYSEVQESGYMYDGVYHKVPEMIPEIVAPDLTGCELKPYVSYRTADIHQSEFTAQDLFDVVYRSKITKDFKENKLDNLGNPLEPNQEEQLTPEEAWINARKTGSDLFSERIPRLWECLEQSVIDKPAPQIQYSYDDLTHPSESKQIPSNTPPEPPERKEIVGKKRKQY